MLSRVLRILRFGIKNITIFNFFELGTSVIFLIFTKVALLATVKYAAYSENN